MKRRQALRLLGYNFAKAAALAQEAKPQVVFIGHGDVGPYGGGELRGTP